jgi:protein-serine/threonine kinase
VPPRDLRPDCPPWLQEIILTCLEVRPQKRYQSAGQLALALAAPDQVPLTARAQRHGRSGVLSRLRRWFFAVGNEPDTSQPGATATLSRSPILMVAVDTESADPELLVALRETTQRLALSLPDARLACVSILRTARIGMDERVDHRGQSLHVKKLVQLKHWARPIGKALGLDEGRLTYHVLEAPDPAAAVIDFAQRGKVDQIVMGARGSSTLRRYLGSVSSQVVAAADCTVTVVRVPPRAGAVADEAPAGRDDRA